MDDHMDHFDDFDGLEGFGGFEGFGGRGRDGLGGLGGLGCPDGAGGPDGTHPFERRLTVLMRDSERHAPFEPRHRERLWAGV
ncbi:hypothetical protein G3I35_21325, partial [Streptomyces sp. SID10815]|nr:hypothetical protein [Streptomyces sp. SID10815]